ncbi:uncharacterized protein PgNI_08012 [Pyricularia grisea]|uniref:Uncharacterized protein n=1 Tax=Pyricularia grisea TaxID=148305 RepID=A0A6P8AWM6_PYRGI|nr:uncharacterized protein PgNI_08012 [Pyricularia grisea]TLD06605.1 hypothetical protein PgNI_08012 [Pyricularia grisea]
MARVQRDKGSSGLHDCQHGDQCPSRLFHADRNEVTDLNARVIPQMNGQAADRLAQLGICERVVPPADGFGFWTLHDVTSDHVVEALVDLLRGRVGAVPAVNRLLVFSGAESQGLTEVCNDGLHHGLADAGSVEVAVHNNVIPTHTALHSDGVGLEDVASCRRQVGLALQDVIIAFVSCVVVTRPRCLYHKKGLEGTHVASIRSQLADIKQSVLLVGGDSGPEQFAVGLGAAGDGYEREWEKVGWDHVVGQMRLEVGDRLGQPSLQGRIQIQEHAGAGAGVFGVGGAQVVGLAKEHGHAAGSENDIGCVAWCANSIPVRDLGRRTTLQSLVQLSIYYNENHGRGQLGGAFDARERAKKNGRGELLNDLTSAAQRMLRVQWHKGRAGLEYCQHGHDVPSGVAEAQGNLHPRQDT